MDHVASAILVGFVAVTSLFWIIFPVTLLYIIAFMVAFFSIFLTFLKPMIPILFGQPQEHNWLVSLLSAPVAVLCDRIMLLVFILECSTHLCCTILFLSTFQFKAFLINIPMVAYHINVMAKHDTEPRVKLILQEANSLMVLSKLIYYLFSMYFYYNTIVSNLLNT